ncbi:histidine phosphatase family protein [Mycobacterium sp. shizuoka-1]|uniref:histidine phosphatase family protein n=1 Tax=Mycobacterium sp. shizuoka-1 TaxID=2039281 RepID=UPI000C06140D|nr:histidine phosphatase family protein [Mycobacterium sp. shizuoka-1]GAY15892.1 phosphoglycerate mutase [Mycobacterium sp. shizuoka-1]
MSGRLILLRHGQSHGNVERRLDTRPPGADLTDLGREQAREFALARSRPPGLLVHSIARRAAQTAEEIGRQLRLSAEEFDGIHEVQAGELENRNDDAAIAEFNEIYQRWHQGELAVAMPGGESAGDVLDRYLPVITDLRLRYLDDHAWTDDIVVVSHGAAIRLVAATLAGVESSFVLDHHLANTEAVVLSPITDGRWSCVQWGALSPPFYPEPDLHPVADALESVDPMG